MHTLGCHALTLICLFESHSGVLQRFEVLFDLTSWEHAGQLLKLLMRVRSTTCLVVPRTAADVQA